VGKETTRGFLNRWVEKNKSLKMPFWKYPQFNTLISIDNPLVRSNWRREKVGGNSPRPKWRTNPASKSLGGKNSASK
jgi:hypothetical protein